MFCTLEYPGSEKRKKIRGKKTFKAEVKGGLKSEVDTLLPQGRDPASTRKMRRTIIFHFFFFVTI